MRRLLLLAILLSAFLVSRETSSQVLMDENFNYPAGDSLVQHGWVWNTGTTNQILVATPGLTYSGYINSGIGNSCR